jgi:hypothetical protein
MADTILNRQTHPDWNGEKTKMVYKFPKNMKLFLLIGQSNMAGRGVVEAQDKIPVPGIFMLDKAGNWVPARDPVHFDKPQIAGVGLCSQFARDVLKAEPGQPVGLIPCAFGGTSLKQWEPGGKLYSDAVERTKTALKNGSLAAILWHQGEADSGPSLASSYSERFVAMISSLRKELGAERTPLLIGELGRYGKGYERINLELPKIPKTIPLCALVSSEGLTANPDNVHFNAASLRTFGSRYAEAYFKLKAEAAAKP